MSETLATSTKPTLYGATDARVLAEVEKWMAVIREIAREYVKN
jgi:hypothetical protein